MPQLLPAFAFRFRRSSLRWRSGAGSCGERRRPVCQAAGRGRPPRPPALRARRDLVRCNRKYRACKPFSRYFLNISLQSIRAEGITASGSEAPAAKPTGGGRMFWDQVTGVYDGFVNLINRKTQQRRKQIPSELIDPEDVVLECACGTGFLSAGIAASCRRLTATELSWTMLRKAKKNCGPFPGCAPGPRRLSPAGGEKIEQGSFLISKYLPLLFPVRRCPSRTGRQIPGPPDFCGSFPAASRISSNASRWA